MSLYAPPAVSTVLGWAGAFAFVAVACEAEALRHMRQAAEQGMICGLSGPAHCWACTAAPALATFALAALAFAARIRQLAPARR